MSDAALGLIAASAAIRSGATITQVWSVAAVAVILTSPLYLIVYPRKGVEPCLPTP